MNHLGVLPCAGHQTRLKELTFSKELLPLFDGRPVIQHSIDCLRRATSQLIAVVNPKKKDLIRYLKSQSIPVIKSTSKGPIDSLTIASATSPNDPFLFALTDTFYQPEDVFVQLAKHPKDNVLGLFQSHHPDHFDSVKTYLDRVIEYAVKTSPAISQWTMGCGKLEPKVLHHTVKKGELIFGNLFQPLTEQKILYALKFSDSSYSDLGTPQSYIEYLLHRFPPSPTKT